MKKGPQELTDVLTQRIEALTIRSGRQPSLPVTHDFTHKNISDAISIDPLIKELCKQFLVPSNMTSSKMYEILEALDEQFQTTIKSFKQQICTIDPKTVEGLKKLNLIIPYSAPRAYIRDVIGLINHLLTLAKPVLPHEQFLDINFDILDIFSEWLDLLEAEELLPSQLHEYILSYTLHKGNLIAETYIRQGMSHFEIWMSSKEGTPEREKDRSAIEHYFEKAVEIAHINQQNLNDFRTLYNKQLAIEIPIFVPFIFANAFAGHFKLAREYAEKIYYQMIVLPKYSLYALSAFPFYLKQLRVYNNNSFYLHQAVDWYERISRLVEEKDFIPELGFDGANYIKIFKKLFDAAYGDYQEGLEHWVNAYGFTKKSATTTEIVYTMPSASFNAQITTALPNIRRNLPSKQISISVSGKSLSIKFSLDVSLDGVQRAVDEVGKLFLTLQAKTTSARSISHDVAPVNPTCVLDVDESTMPSLVFLETPTVDSVSLIHHKARENITQENRQQEQKKEKESEKEKEKENVTQKKKARTNRKVHSTAKKAGSRAKKANARTPKAGTIPSAQPMAELEAILETKSPTQPFKKPEFEAAKICELKGAKGIFVAYNPQLSFIKPKKLDTTIEERYCKMFDHPSLASATNCNGFKWVSNNNMGASLVGKLTREKYRLFPVEKEINDAGETAFFYGEIRNAKNGKKKNRYG